MKKLIPSYVRVPVIFAAVFAAMEYFIDSGEKPAFIYCTNHNFNGN